MNWRVLVAVGVLVLPSVAAANFECLIEAAQVVEIRSPVEGVIAKVHVQRGQMVRRGQVLVELASEVERAAAESARFRAQMDGQIFAARSRVDYATKKLARIRELHAESFVSAQARDEAEAERRLAEAELKAAIESRDLAHIEHRRAVEQLALRTLTSPLNGVVMDRLLNPGDLAESGAGRKPVLKLAQIDPLKVDIVLPGPLFGQVRPGMKATITPQGSATRYTAPIRFIDRVMDAASGTFVARVDLPNPKHAVAGGVRCTAQIEGIEGSPQPARAKPH